MKHFSFFLTLLLLTACTRDPESGPAPGVGQTPMQEFYIPGVFRIKLRETAAELDTRAFTRSGSGSGIAAFDAAATRAGATAVQRVFSNGDRFRERRRRAGLHLWYDVHFSGAISVAEAMERFGRVDEVECIEPVPRMVPAGATVSQADFSRTSGSDNVAIPGFDDPLLVNQWIYHRVGAAVGSTAVADLNIFPAWSVSTGHKDVVVAVVAGGIDYTHPDLAANIWRDGQGACGYNFCRHNTEITPSSHGTHVAGTIGAVNNNGIGVCGVAGGTGKGDGVRLMSCQIFSGDLTGDALVSSRAVKYAADHGASILQCSWGIMAGIYTSDNMFIKQSPMDYEALQYFAAQKNCEALDGGLIVFSAGNESTAMSGYPAGYRDYISVTSFSPDYLPANYTNYGPGCNIAAPGGETSGLSGGEKAGVLSTLCSETSNGADYGYMQGTSMACPHVSGVAALGLSYALEKGKRFSLDEFKTMLLTSVNEIDSRLGEDSKATIADVSIYRGKMGTGITDAYQLLMQIEGTPCLQVALGEVQLIPLTQHFGQGAEDLTYTDIQMSAKDMEKLGIKAAPKMYNGKLMIKCTKPGSAKIKVSAIAGGTKPGTGVVMGGMVITKEFAVIARSAGAANGGWL